MKPVALLSCLFVCLSLLTACGKKEDEGAPTVAARPEKKVKAVTTESKKTAAPVGDAPAPGEPVPFTPMKTVEALDLVVADFVTQYRRTPDTLDELIQKKLIPRLPPPSPGMRFELVKDNKKKTAHVVEVPQ